MKNGHQHHHQYSMQFNSVFNSFNEKGKECWYDITVFAKTKQIERQSEQKDELLFGVDIPLVHGYLSWRLWRVISLCNLAFPKSQLPWSTPQPELLTEESECAAPCRFQSFRFLFAPNTDQSCVVRWPDVYRQDRIYRQIPVFHTQTKRLIPDHLRTSTGRSNIASAYRPTENMAVVV